MVSAPYWIFGKRIKYIVYGHDWIRKRYGLFNEDLNEIYIYDKFGVLHSIPMLRGKDY